MIKKQMCIVAGLVLTTRHLSGFSWGPPTQDTGRCCSRCLFRVSGWWYSPSWRYKLPWLWLLLECVCWWLVYPVPWLLCTTGVQPHPARVQSVWLGPGEAVNQPSTTHTLHTPSTCIYPTSWHGRLFTTVSLSLCQRSLASCRRRSAAWWCSWLSSRAWWRARRRRPAVGSNTSQASPSWFSPPTRSSAY